MVIAIGGAVGMALVLASFSRMLVDGSVFTQSAHDAATVQVATLPIDNTTNVDAKPSPSLIRALRAVPGVAGIEPVIGVVGGTRSEFCALAGLPQGFPFSLIAGTADPARFARGDVLVGATVARETGVRAGGLLALPGRDGTTRVRVQGIWANGDCNGAAITMPHWLLEHIWGPQPPLFLYVRPQPGVSAERLAGRIEAARLDPHLAALAPNELQKTSRSELALQLQPFWLVQRVLIVLVFVSVLFSLLLTAVYRRRELGLAGAVGMGPRDIGIMVVAEAIAVGAVGAIGGIGFGVGALDAFRHAFFFFLPIKTHFLIDARALVVYTVVAIAVAVVAAAVPAWRASRLAVVDAIRYE
jgi:putative ABC transport system permease protein